MVKLNEVHRDVNKVERADILPEQQPKRKRIRKTNLINENTIYDSVLRNIAKDINNIPHSRKEFGKNSKIKRFAEAVENEEFKSILISLNKIQSNTQGKSK